jgi:hypothetical protein
VRKREIKRTRKKESGKKQEANEEMLENPHCRPYALNLGLIFWCVHRDKGMTRL